MLKKVLFFICISFSLVTTSFATNSSSKGVSLYVVNSWTQKVRVKEGEFMRQEKILFPGQNLSWDMAFKINNLSVSYMKDGKWVDISNCFEGSHPPYSISIMVTPHPRDSKKPWCEGSIG